MAAQAQGSGPDFADLFEKPSIERMLTELDSTQFEHFVKYVLEQAGYFVEHTGHQYGPGLDLRVYVGPTSNRTFHAGVSVKQFTSDLVNGPQVVNLRGSLGRLRAGGYPGYVVTTSGFNKPAHDAAEPEPRIWLVDGEHFIRYIHYVRGSRAEFAPDAEADALLHTNPLAPIPPEALIAADAIPRRPVKTTRVLVLANNKGGVGKTTSALNIAFGLAAHDRQVLLVDMDAQANLTRALQPPAPGATPAHIGDYFTRKRQLADIIRPTQLKRVWLIPSDKSLVGSDMGIAAGPGAELRFARDLHAPSTTPPPVLDARPFDWIIIDTGPHMGLFTRSALAAAHDVLMPMSPSAFADQGTDLLVTTVQTMAALMGAPIAILGFLITQWQENTLNKDLLKKFEDRVAPAGLTFLKDRIPLDKAHIEKAHLETGAGKRRVLLDTTCAAARAYKAVVEEIM